MVTLFQGGGATAPAQFGTGDWSIAALGNGTSARITITTLPSDGGSAITDLEYQIDGGSWVSLAGTTTGNYDLSGLSWAVEIDVAIRAVNAGGNGTASATKAVTPWVSWAAVLALNPEIAWAASVSGSTYQERTGASATTPSGNGEVAGSIKNFGTLGGWLTAPTDPRRGIMRHSGALRYVEGDGSDDIYTGALGALRGAAGWTSVDGVRNTGSTAAARTPSVVLSGSGSTRASALFNVTTGAATLIGRRNNGDSAAVIAGSAHADVDIILTGISDYTNTDAFLLVDAVQEATSTSWLTSGVTPNDQGAVNLFGLETVGPNYVNLMAGRCYSRLLFASVLSAGNLLMVQRWTAQEIGKSI